MSDRNTSPIKFPAKLKPATIVLIVVAGIIVVGLFSSFYTVGEYEQAVILFLGKYKTVVGSGLHLKLPFGIEKNYNIYMRTITQEFGYRTTVAGVQSKFKTEGFEEEAEMLTGDKNIVDVKWSIQYEIVDPKAWLFNVEHMVQDNPRIEPRIEKNLYREGDFAFEKTIRDLSQSVINQIVGDKSILGVIGNERQNIQDQAIDLMNDIFNDKYNMGIQVTQIALQDTLPPVGDVRDAFEDVNKAEQDKERYINEGLEEYNKAIPEEQGKAKRLVQEATGYAAARVNIARGDVARFNAVLKEYLKAPDVTRARLYIEMYEEVFLEGGNTELIDRNLKNFIPFKTLGSVPAAQEGGEL